MPISGSSSPEIIGHHADILLGLLLIPVGRNTILGRVFGLHYSTLLYAHKANAYLTVAAVFAHGAAYYVSMPHTMYWAVLFTPVLTPCQSFVGAYAAAPDSSPRKAAYDIDNPAFTMEQAEQRGPYVSATLGTGTLSDLLMLAIVVTALPVLRRRSYNTFYYVHIILSCLIFISACIHASTDFYFLLRSLILWMLDWALRIFRGDSGLGKTVTATLEAAGHGWYRVTLKPSKGVTSPVEEPADGYASGDEKQLPTPPIQSFYLNIPSVSRVQNHTFTAAKTATNDTGPVFLLQRAPLAGRRKPGTSEGKEWTWKLGRLLGSHGGGDDGQATAAREVTCRVEGPYTPLGTAHETAERVVCIVGGTGFTGAYSLAMWWSRWRARDAGSHFTLLWTMRDRDTASLKEWTEMVGIVDAIPNMTLTLHVSSESGRIDPPQELRRAFALSEGMRKEKRAAWVYVSGPAGFLSDVEDACLQVKQEVTKSNTGGLLAVTRVDYYIAKWET